MAAGMIGAFFLGVKLGISSMSDDLSKIARSQSIDRSNYLHVLRRELANHLIRRDPTRFQRIYRKILEEVIEYEKLSTKEQKIRLAALCSKFPQYSDFDLLMVKDYVLYADCLNGKDNDEIEDHYQDIIRFHSLQSIVDKNWHPFYEARDPDYGHLARYIQRVKDSRLEMSIQEAMQLYFQFRCKVTDQIFETPEFSVCRVSHFAETRYGIHVKASNEFGLYTIFTDTRDYISFLRSDARFEEEMPLDTIAIDKPI